MRKLLRQKNFRLKKSLLKVRYEEEFETAEFEEPEAYVESDFDEEIGDLSDEDFDKEKRLMTRISSAILEKTSTKT